MADSPTPPPGTEAHPPPPASAIREWIVARVSEHAERDAEEIHTDKSLLVHGIDSMQFVLMVGEMEEWLGCQFRSNPIAVYPTIDGLSEWLATELAAGRTDLNPRTDFSTQDSAG